MLVTTAQQHDLVFSTCVRTRPRLQTIAAFPRARAREPAVFRVASATCRRKSSTCAASPQVVSKRGATRSRVASPAHVVSGNQASTRSVTCPRSVREPGGIAITWMQGASGVTGAVLGFTPMASPGVTGRGVRAWRHLLTWQTTTWRRRTWRQNVASGLQNVSPVVGRCAHPHRRPP